MKKSILKSLFAGALLLAGAAQAHTTALGTINAGAPGSVTLWLGTYHNGSPLEGSMTLNGTTTAFAMTSATRPTGLIDGVNTFHADNGATGSYTKNNPITSLNSWQGVTFTGLAAGTYTYSITGMNTIQWSDWNSSTPNWTGTLTIPGSSVMAVPEPSILALMGLGLLGLGFSRRKMAK